RRSADRPTRTTREGTSPRKATRSRPGPERSLPRRSPAKRPQHRHAPPIVVVGASVLAYEVPFLELDGHEDVRRGRDREEQVREGHRRRHPEREEPADVEGCRTRRYGPALSPRERD